VQGQRLPACATDVQEDAQDCASSLRKLLILYLINIGTAHANPSATQRCAPLVCTAKSEEQNIF
jgi:hypothetical protein